MARLKDRKDIARRAGDNYLIALDKIKVNPQYNQRNMDSPSTLQYIREMADSIKESGTVSFPAITVKQVNDDIFVYAGHCRLAAHKLARDEGAEVKGILATIVDKSLSEADLVLDIIKSNNGLPLTRLEKANTISKLRSFRWTPVEIAKKLGWHVNTVYDLLKLIDAPETIKEMVRNDEVSPSLAIQEIKSNPGQAEEKLTKAVQKAKASGKTKATGKHIAGKPKVRLPMHIFNVANIRHEMQAQYSEVSDELIERVVGAIMRLAER